MDKIQDQYFRTFKTLRISLVNACNLACLYCVNPEEKQKASEDTAKTLSLERLVRIVDELRKTLPLESIRLTGGEPTLFKELIPLIRQISSLGDYTIKMTSNGYLLAGMAKELAEAGLKEVNISLDAIDQEVFYKVSRRKDLYRILDAIESCLRYDIKVKLNTVVLKGINDSQMLPLVHYASERNIPIRFLELMKMGHLYSNAFDTYFYSESEILSTLASEYTYIREPREEGATANYWLTSEGYRFGIIANESSPFCGDCNRLRLDSGGNIYGCLSENIPVPLYDCLDDATELTNRLYTALRQKQTVKFKGSELAMISIGG